jgi:hypothetical protein
MGRGPCHFNLGGSWWLQRAEKGIGVALTSRRSSGCPFGYAGVARDAEAGRIMS